MTSRRNFLRGILVAGASFMILPGAGRVWRAERRLDIRELIDIIYQLKRKREADGGEFIDAFMLGTPIQCPTRWNDLPTIEVPELRTGSIYEQLLRTGLIPPR